MRAGLGVRPELFGPILDTLPNLGFFEAHSENYFGSSLARAKLIELRSHYPISLHGVGLSLGRADDLDEQHLGQLKALVDEIDPMFVSEHLSWSAYAHRHLPDLLPLPLTEQALSIMCEHVDRMQTVLGRRVLVENPSNYLVFDQLQIPEPEFLNELAKRSGCGLLLDINNVHVSAHNLARSAKDYIEGLNSDAICQYHLAGYSVVEKSIEGGTEEVFIDTHNQPVYPKVWNLFENTIALHGAKPTLFEWDSDFPEMAVLLEECDKADAYLQEQKPKSTWAAQDKPGSQGRESGELDLHGFQDEFLQDVLAHEISSVDIVPSLQQRFSVYRNNVFGALQDYMADLFPACKGVLGEAYFKQTVQQYIQADPPKQGNLHCYGESFGVFLEELKLLESLPYIVDLASLEWHLHNLYYLAGDPNLDLSIDQAELLNTPVSLSRNHAIIDSNFPLYEIHRQSLPDFNGDVAIRLEQSSDSILVFKNEYAVEHQVLTTSQRLFLRELPNFETLMQAIDGLAGSLAQDELGDALALVFSANLLRSNHSQ